MDQNDRLADIVAQWLAEVDRLDRWQRERALSDACHALALERMRGALRALAARQQAVPAETPGEPMRASDAQAQRIDQRLHGQRDARPTGFNETCLKRDGLLRLSVWRALRCWQESMAGAAAQDDAFDALLLRVAGTVSDVPPGIAPALTYACSASALAFFNEALRGALRRLGGAYPQARQALLDLADLPPFDDTGVAVQRWGRAWTAAVFGVYVDWLKQRSNARIDGAMADVWGAGAGTVRFKAPAGLAVLPTRERCMHIDLWTGLVPAQLLAHDAARFQRQADGTAWHRVRLAMHDLGERDLRQRGGTAVHTLFRGLGVEMIYQAVFADAVERTLPPPTEDAAMPAHAPKPTAPAGAPLLAWLGAGQQPNIRLLQRWQPWPTPLLGPNADRRADPAPAGAAAMTPAQQRVFDAWLQSQRVDPDAAHAVQAADLHWRGAVPGTGFRDEQGLPLVNLGQAALWAAAGADAQWLDVAFVVRSHGRWHPLPLLLHDVAVDGGLHTRLLADPAAASSPALDLDRIADALGDPARCFWSVHRGGLGAFVLGAVDLERDAA